MGTLAVDESRSLLSESGVVVVVVVAAAAVEESKVEQRVSDCLTSERRRDADESETRRRDFKSTAWRSLPAAVVVEEQSGCEFEGRTSGRRALREYLRVVRFDEFLMVEASSDVNSGV